jgi:hypothetical protein
LLRTREKRKLLFGRKECKKGRMKIEYQTYV